MCGCHTLTVEQAIPFKPPTNCTQCLQRIRSTLADDHQSIVNPSLTRAMDTSTRHKRIELRQAIVDLREHGLLMQAQWAAEQLAGLPADDDTSALPPPTAPSAAQLDDAYLLARTHFDLKVCPTTGPPVPTTAVWTYQEYRRCAHALQGATDPLHVFLRCYATYLYGEKRKECA